MPHIEIIRRFAENAGEPILIAGRDLCGRDNFFADGGDAGHFAPDRFGIFDFQRARAAPARANAARGRAAGKNQDHIFAETRDLRFDLRLRAVADADHRDDRADADDDAERGQHGTQFVSAQGAKGDLESGTESHRRDVSVCSVLVGLDIQSLQFLHRVQSMRDRRDRSERHRRASRHCGAHTTRCPASCVTMMMVMPVFVQLLKNSHDLDARPAVEIAGRLIREHDFGIVDQARARSRRAAAGRRKAGSDDDLRGRSVRPTRARWSAFSRNCAVAVADASP